MGISGRDISEFQGDVDFDRLAGAGIDFVIMRASQGVGFVDGKFARNQSEARRTGIPRGYYHFADNTGTPQAQADHFLATVGGLQPGESVWLDQEEGYLGNDFWVAFMNYVHGKVGFPPGGYASSSYYTAHGLANPGDDGDWVAQWSALAPNPPPGWSFVAIWQNADNGSIPILGGGTTNCDTDIFNGDVAGFLRYGAPGAVPAPQPAPTPAPTPTPTPAPTPAPSGVTWVNFSGTVDVDTANVRGGASTAAAVLRSVGRGTSLGFDGWQYGTVVYDATAKQNDARWFHINQGSGYGWIASALVNGNPPNSSPLPGGTPAPAPAPAPAPVPAPNGIAWENFSGTVQVDSAHVRNGASLTASVLRDVTDGTGLGFDGWCFGPEVYDPVAKQNDARWYHIDAAHGYGWIASALVNGNAPGSRPQP